MSYSPTVISAEAASVVPYETAQPSRQLWVSPSGSNANPGTEAAPFRTVQAGVAAAAPGTAVMVKAGTYTENVKITKSGTADKPIWIASADGEGAAAIKAANTGASVVYGHGIDNVVLQGFRLSGGTEGVNITQSGTSLTNMATNIVVEDNISHGHSRDGIKTSQTVNSAVTDNTVYDISAQEGIDNVYMRNGIIADNTVSDVRGLTGIIAKGGSSNVRIEDNTVSGVRDGVAVGGFTTGQGSIFPSGLNYEARNVTVSDNAVSGRTKAVGVFGAQDSIIRDNDLKTAGTWVATVGADNNGWASRGIQFANNDVSKTNWLTASPGSVTVNSGNAVPGTTGPIGNPPQSGTIPTDTTVHDWRDSGASTRTITGTAVADTLTGTTGNDTINGGAAIDRMTGLAGDDRYVISSRYDVAVESAGQGRDTVSLWDISYTLAPNVENLVISKSAGAAVRDNGLDNIITSGAGPDTFTLSGAHGDDLVRNFQVGTDHVRFSVPASDLDKYQTPAGELVIKDPGGSVTLAGIPASTEIAAVL